MDNATMGEFVLAVEEMRVAQRGYFKDRSKRSLEVSLRMERRVDALVKEMKVQLHIVSRERKQGDLPF